MNTARSLRVPNLLKEISKRICPVGVAICFLVATSGCATLREDEYARHGYRGAFEVKRGIRLVPLDWLANVFGAFPKLILWNWKVNRHHFTPSTEEAIRTYLAEHSELGDVQVQLNRWAPHEAFKRLFVNKQVAWPYRLTIGFITVLIAEVIWPSRLIGADRYNPFTHQVYLYSDLPSIALHELGHAKDFARRRYKGSYALFRIVPFVDLYQEREATNYAFEFARRNEARDLEIESYKVLNPAMGTYVGSYLLMPFGGIIGAIIGHVQGRNAVRLLEESETT